MGQLLLWSTFIGWLTDIRNEGTASDYLRLPGARIEIKCTVTFASYLYALILFDTCTLDGQFDGKFEDLPCLLSSRLFFVWVNTSD